MIRVRVSLAKKQNAQYRYLDLVHDALINAWCATDAVAEDVIGQQAKPWTFAALGRHDGKTGIVHTLVVSTSDDGLGRSLAQLNPANLRYARASTGELFDFSAAELSIETDPISSGQGVLSALLLSPMLIRERGSRNWHSDLAKVPLADAVNHRLSRLAGRPVKLSIQADSLYLRANPKHSVLVATKGSASGRASFVIGMQAPLVLAGSEQDLRLAWYAGIGEKNRNGFGCLGLLEHGVGR